jgi:hypothetical protein
MQGLTLTCLSTCPSDKEVIENVVFDARIHFIKWKASLFTYHYYRESGKNILPSAYWLHCPFKINKQFTWLAFQMHMFCALVGKQSLPHRWLKMIYNWANNSLTSEGYDHRYTCCYMQLWLWSHNKFIYSPPLMLYKQFKVNGTDPYMAMVYLHIGLLLWLVMVHPSV